MRGEDYASKMKLADTVILVRIADVVPLAATHLDRWYLRAESPVIWYIVRCSLLDVERGRFDEVTPAFIVCWGIHRNSWPYVRGFCYQLGLSQSDGRPTIIAQVRVSRLPPHSQNDYTPFDVSPRGGGTNEADVVFWLRNRGADCVDVALEKQKYVVFTYVKKDMSLTWDKDWHGSTSVLVYRLNTKQQIPAVLKDDGRLLVDDGQSPVFAPDGFLPGSTSLPTNRQERSVGILGLPQERVDDK